MTEAEARLQILGEHKRLSGNDAAVDAQIERLTRPSGRDLYLRRIGHLMDAEPQLEPVGCPPGVEPSEALEEEEQRDDDAEPEEAAHGRDSYVQRLGTLCEHWARKHRANLESRSYRP